MDANQINTLKIEEKPNISEITTPNQQYILRVRAIGLKYNVALWLHKKASVIQSLFLDYETKSKGK